MKGVKTCPSPQTLMQPSSEIPHFWSKSSGKSMSSTAHVFEINKTDWWVPLGQRILKCSAISCCGRVIKANDSRGLIDKTHLAYLMMSKSARLTCTQFFSFLFSPPSVSRLHQSGPLLWGPRILIPVTVINEPCYFTPSTEEESIASPGSFILSSGCVSRNHSNLWRTSLWKNQCLVPAKRLICAYLWQFIWNSCTEKWKCWLIFVVLCSKNKGCFLTHNISLKKSRDLCRYQHVLSSMGCREKERKVGEDQVSAKKGFYFLPYINADVRLEDGFKEQCCVHNCEKSLKWDCLIN